MPDRVKTVLRLAYDILWVAFLVWLIFADTDGAAYALYRKWLRPIVLPYLMISLTWGIIKYDVKGWREKGWRGLFVVQAVEFLWTVITVITCMTLYFAGSLLIRTIGAFIHRVLLSPEHSKWAWVRGVRDQPLDKRSEGFWKDSVASYKWYVKWDHDEAVKAVDYYRNLTKRRREWAAKVAPVADGGEA
jgi:hypothetical protein